MMKLLFKVFLISLVIFGAIVFNGEKASAASDYDDAYQTTDTLEMLIGDEIYNMTQTWPALLSGEPIEDDLTVQWRSHNNSVCSPSTEPCGNTTQIVQDWIDNKAENWTISITKGYDENTLIGGSTIQICYTTTDIMGLSWNINSVNISLIEVGNYYCIDIASNSDNNDLVWIRGRQFSSGQFTSISQLNAAKYNYVANINEENFNYPIDYEGLPIRQTVPEPLKKLIPEYTYNVNNTGLLSIKYLGNLEHFLSGTNLLDIDKMTSNWDAIDENIESNSVLAGSLDVQYQLPGAGYYMITISHDQQLSIPPWSENDEIDQVLMQFYWNGHSPVTGDNIGGCDGICNDQRHHNNKILRAIEQAQFSDGGLQGLIFAPINAIAILPTLGDSCTPINFPILDEDVTMQCIRPMVQASPFGAVYATISVIITGLITWWVALKTFALIKGLQDPDDDKVEVLKL